MSFKKYNKIDFKCPLCNGEIVDTGKHGKYDSWHNSPGVKCSNKGCEFMGIYRTWIGGGEPVVVEYTTSKYSTCFIQKCISVDLEKND